MTHASAPGPIANREMADRLGTACRTRRPAFTIIELLVVTAIIAILTSLLLPTLKLAKDAARAAVCAQNMSQIGQAGVNYSLDFDNYFPSPATYGLTLMGSGAAGPDGPTTTWDSYSALLVYLGQKPQPSRNGRLLQTVSGLFRCPANGRYSAAWCSDSDYDSNSREECGPPGFLDLGIMQAMSYGVPTTMLVTGEDWGGYLLQAYGVDGAPYCASSSRSAPLAGPLAAVQLPGSYIAKVDEVGAPSRKVFTADATRFVTYGGLIITDVGIEGRAHFATDGGWSRDSHEYSEQQEGKVPAYLLSYRHGDTINMVFFDGHVERVPRLKSHFAGYWMPTGTEIIEDNGLVDPNNPDQDGLYIGPGQPVP